MKIWHKIFAGVCFAFPTLNSCILDERIISQTHGMVQVEIAESVGAVVRSDNEVMSTIRLVVFTDLDTAPRAEINKLYSYGDFTVEPPVGGYPPKVKFFLKVERKESGPNRKLVVAVINEPATSEMKAILDGIVAPDDLETIELDMSHFVSDDHLSLKNGVTIPMTGALWTDRLFRTKTEASLTGNILTLEVQRAVARVDVYLKKGADVEPNLKIASGSIVKLNNTCTESNFFYHSDGVNTIGSIPTVWSGFVNRSWAYTSSSPKNISETEPVCVFYTPEREHAEYRLKLDIDIKTSEGATRSGSLEITRAKDVDGIEHDVDKILRNHIYKVTATVGVNGITADIIDWNDENLSTDF